MKVVVGFATAQADATVLSTLVVLQHVVSSGGRETHRPTVHVVGMVRRPATVEVANYLVGEAANPDFV